MTTTALVRTAKEVLCRWTEALSRPHDHAGLEAILCSDVRIDVHEPAARGSVGELRMTISGIAAAAAWLQLAPPGGRFELASRPVATGRNCVVVEYVYRHGSFVNGGRWVAMLAGTRIAWMMHGPFALTERAP